MEASAAVTVRGWRCPACARHATELVERFRAPGDDHGGVVMIDLARCLACGQPSVAWWPGLVTGGDGMFFAVEPAAWLGLRTVIQGCPRPADGACPCTAHCRMTILCGLGGWQGLRRLETGGACAASPGHETIDPRRLRLPWQIARSLTEPWHAWAGGHEWGLAVDGEGRYELRVDGTAWGSLAEWPATWIHPERPFGWTAA
jgi:hypothetical protein